MDENKLKALLADVKSCCHNGHGASVFADMTAMQAISSNDIIARRSGDGWENRVAYINDPEVTLDTLRAIFENQNDLEITLERLKTIFENQ